MHPAQSFPETAAVHGLGNEMETYHGDEESETASVYENIESEPFLTPPSSTSWVAPKGFVWIEIGTTKSLG